MKKNQPHICKNCKYLISIVLVLYVTFLVAKTEHSYDANQLSSNLIIDICKDKQGYLWISTRYGLNKFDGVHFTHYFNNPDTSTISSNDIKKVLVDKSGCVWLLTSNAVQRYNPDDDAFQLVAIPEKERSLIRAIAEDNLGHLLLLTSKTGLFMIDRNRMKAQPVASVNKELSNYKCSKLFVDTKRRLWLITEDGNLVQITYKGIKKVFFTKTKYAEGRLDYENKLIGMVESEGHIYLASHKNIYVYQEKSFKFDISLKSSVSINTLYKDCFGNLWAVSDGHGLYTIDLHKKILLPVYPKLDKGVDLSKQKISAFYRDMDNNIWLGCFQKGLFYINNKKNPFNYISLGENRFLAMLFTNSKGHIFVGSGDDGLQEISPEGNVTRQYLSGVKVVSAYENKDNSLWIGTDDNGACLYNPLTEQKTWLDSLEGIRIKAFTKDKRGNIYIAAFNKGLYSYDASGTHQRILCRGKIRLHNTYLISLMTDKRNRIWIGHYYGLDVYDANLDRMVDIPMDSVLRKATTFSLVETDGGYIWAGTNKGLFRFSENNKQWKRYSVDNGLPNECICAVVDSKDGHLWISTFKGLSRMDIRKETFVNYYNGNGLQYSNYSRGVACISEYGMIGFGNDNGFTYFIPKNVGNNGFRKNIMMTGILISGERVNARSRSGGRYIIDNSVEKTNKMRLSYQDNTFTLLFSTMDYRDVENVYYQYRFDDDREKVWHSTNAGVSEITFSHLSWGKHQLLVRACDNGEYSAVKKITIYIMPPWYASWWAYIAYALFLGFFLYLFWTNYNRKRISDENEAKIRLFVDFSHELRSPLTMIKNPLDILMKKSFDEDTWRALCNMKRNTDRLLLLVNQILSIRKIERGQMHFHYAETNLVAFVKAQCEIFAYQAEENGISLIFNSSDECLTAWIDCSSFDKIISNLISNALKYVKKGGEIKVSVLKGTNSRGKGTIVLKVADTGPGIDENQINNIFDRFFQATNQLSGVQLGFGIGLNLTRRIVVLHGGTIVAHNREDCPGAEFVVTLLSGKDHLVESDIVSPDYFKNNIYLGEPMEHHSDDVNVRGGSKKKTSYKVVVVDDDEDMLHYLETELGQIYHVRVFNDSYEALSYIIENVPDTVITDIKMPKMDGFTLMRRLKNNTKSSHVPVILLTSEVESRSRLEGFEYGADAYIDKPFDIEELKARVAALIANRMRMKGKYSGAQEQQSVIQQIDVKGNDEELMEKIMKVMNERLSEEQFNVGLLASEVGLSRVQLHRRLKEMTGIPASDFIRNFRLQQAAKLLEAGDVSISQITYAIGLSNPTHFSNAFKKYFGVSPKEYMQNHASKDGVTE